MCGIIGYTGKKSASPILLEGLRRLEYRGYDSAGVAVLESGRLAVRKKIGKIDNGIARLLKAEPVDGHLGIAHTRWATHGAPADKNSHPHLDASGKIAVVHNGVIENYESLKQKLLAAGHKFKSDTDTEVLAHLIGERYQRRSSRGNGAQTRKKLEPPHVGCYEAEVLTQAVSEALREVIGTYGLAVICADFPDLIVGARRGSPLIIGIGKGEHFVASDANAIVAHTKKVVYLNDYDVAAITPERFAVTNLGADTANVQISNLEFSHEDVGRGKFAHFMLKEIYEQPQTVLNALRGRVDFEGATAKFGGLNMTAAELRQIDRIVIAASGTSWHAALVGEYLIEELAQLPVEVEFAHEFCYRNCPLEKNTVLLVLSQSGETADTLAALREAKRRGHRALAVVNVVGSTIAREADGGIYMHAGPEIGVASTKAFVSTITVLTLLAIHLGRLRQLSAGRATEILRALEKLPGQIEKILSQSEALKKIARKFSRAEDFFFLGRGYSFPIALEGALKLKEISYIHAEGYSAAEMKHGPIALIDKKTPTMFLVPADAMREKTLANLAMIRARKGPVIALATEGDRDIKRMADEVIFIPKTLDLLNPILASVPLQMFAYCIAVARGCDVDKPRNLAKSVTVQ
ncbi:MAG TPA: glutamine--fructose-6-phosphate transaminase (isomerizing) [Candidatus Sulfotelmatobacter sp.]|jgi:glucosamine--fructose-6-phosphate aminotransferase (isomerizing)|nr:glutamine--fructose-6-phosphate transaminase (isomerizing) [Candidatus Sulfotelmatobacter sp.]